MALKLLLQSLGINVDAEKIQEIIAKLQEIDAEQLKAAINAYLPMMLALPQVLMRMEEKLDVRLDSLARIEGKIDALLSGRIYEPAQALLEKVADAA